MSFSNQSLIKHIRKLSQVIGARPGGTPANHEAANYIENTFQSLGLSVERQTFAMPHWEDLGVSLTYDNKPLEAAANAFSPACDVTANFVPVCSVAELESAKVTGKIALLYGDLTRDPISPKSWFLKSNRDEQIIRLLETKKPSAIVAIQAKAGMLDRLIEDWEFKIPSVSMPAKTGKRLLQQPAATLHLQINSTSTDSTTCNLVARKKGKRQETIAIMAHYDTKFDTPGASDNASGIAILLTLAEQLCKVETECGLEFIAFANEEYMPVGDDEYLKRRNQDLSDILAAINFDGVGQLLGTTSITNIACSKKFQDETSRLAKNYPGIIQVEPWPESNHSTFSFRGIPCIAYTSTGRVFQAHLRTDTVDWINPQKLFESISLTLEIIGALQDKPLDWARDVQ